MARWPAFFCLLLGHDSSARWPCFAHLAGALAAGIQEGGIAVGGGGPSAGSIGLLRDCFGPARSRCTRLQDPVWQAGFGLRVPCALDRLSAVFVPRPVLQRIRAVLHRTHDSVQPFPILSRWVNAVLEAGTTDPSAGQERRRASRMVSGSPCARISLRGLPTSVTLPGLPIRIENNEILTRAGFKRARQLAQSGAGNDLLYQSLLFIAPTGFQQNARFGLAMRANPTFDTQNVFQILKAPIHAANLETPGLPVKGRCLPVPFGVR